MSGPDFTNLQGVVNDLVTRQANLAALKLLVLLFAGNTTQKKDLKIGIIRG